MKRKHKVFDKIKNNPKDVRFNVLKNMLIEEGFILKRTTGSHFVFTKGELTFIVPSHNNKVKEIYVKRVIDLIESFEGENLLIILFYCIQRKKVVLLQKLFHFRVVWLRVKAISNV
jgi:hypothetical protein